jgi:hypothetical protein
MPKPMNETEQRSKTVSLRVKLKPVENSDQPMSATYTTLNVAPGVVYLDFGFLEPSALTDAPKHRRKARRPCSHGL